MRKWTLGTLLALTVVMALPAAAAQGPGFDWPSFDFLGWIADLLGIAEDGLLGFEAGSGQEAQPVDDSPSAEMGPIFDPLG